MPCMGPTEPTDAEVEAVTQAVLDFLRERYHIFPYRLLPVPGDSRPVEEINAADPLFTVIGKRPLVLRKESVEGLQTAIRAVLSRDRIESF